MFNFLLLFLSFISGLATSFYLMFFTSISHVQVFCFGLALVILFFPLDFLYGYHANLMEIIIGYLSLLKTWFKNNTNGRQRPYTSLLKRGTRIALRGKVNTSLITGIRIVDALLPIGRGQRQLILGDL